jgi:hypothetical protein
MTHKILHMILVALLALTELSLPVAAATLSGPAKRSTMARSAVTWQYPSAACPTTIQACINGSADGDTIRLAPGSYLTDTLTITVAISLIGDGITPGDVTLRSTSGRILNIGDAELSAANVISNMTLSDATVTGNNTGAAIIINNNSGVPLLHSLVISNNSAATGAGIRLFPTSPLTLVNVSLINNVTTRPDFLGGGAIFSRGPVTLIDSRVEGNRSVSDGGALYVRDLTLIDTRVRANTAISNGGGIFATNTLHAERSVIESNSAAGNGGGLVTTDLTLINTEVRANSAITAGGGVYVATDADIVGGAIVSNSAQLGGGVWIANDLSIRGTSLISNTALGAPGAPDTKGWPGHGGAAYVNGRTAIAKAFFAANSARGGRGGDSSVAGGVAGSGGDGHGGAIFALGPVTVNHGNFFTNSVLAGGSGVGIIGSPGRAVGGAVYAQAQVSVSDGTFVRNSAMGRSTTGIGVNTLGEGSAGAIFAPKASIQRSLFQENAAAGGPGFCVNPSKCSLPGPSFGGAIWITGTLDLNNSRLIANSGSGNGGALALGELGAGDRVLGTVVNTLFANNTVSNTGTGLSAYVMTSTLRVVHGSFMQTETADGAAIVADLGGFAGLTNTYIASHSVGLLGEAGGGGVWHQGVRLSVAAPVSGTASSSGAQLVENPAAGVFVNPAQFDFHLTPASVAIDAGVVTDFNTDIDGDARPSGSAPDIGYDEFFVAPLPRVLLPLLQRSK